MKITKVKSVIETFKVQLVNGSNIIIDFYFIFKVGYNKQCFSEFQFGIQL